MRHHKINQTTPRFLLAAAVTAVLAAGTVATPIAVHAISSTANNTDEANTQSATQYYSARVKSLNQSNVSGKASFGLENRTLTATINLSGLEPGVHPQHIHGQAEAEAECPTLAADVNHDNFISVLEGAPAYGPIKINLTSPQTPFGTPPTPALFTPFAGTPDNKNFPTAGADGNLHFSQVYYFDNSTAAQGAFDSIKKLDFQHYVVHGGTAPANVDATAFAALGSPRALGYDENEKVYDVLLPVGCGEIHLDRRSQAGNPNNSHRQGNNGGMMNDTDMASGMMNSSDMAAARPTADGINRDVSDLQAQLSLELNNAGQAVAATEFSSTSDQQVTAFRKQINESTMQYNNNVQPGINKDEARNQLINSLASAKDHLVNELNSNRNIEIDALNQKGDVAARDGFLTAFDKAVTNFSSKMEYVKNSL